MIVDELKKGILDSAIQGKLTNREITDSSVKKTIKEIEDIRLNQQKLKLIDKKIINTKIFSEETEVKEYKIPTEWEFLNLGFISKVITDGTHKTPNYIDKGVRFLSVQNISSGSLDLSKIRYISEEEHQKLKKRVLPSMNDILFCRIGTLGHAMKIDFEFIFDIFVSLGLIRLQHNINPDYIVYVLNSPLGSKWIENNKVGGGTHTNKINLNDLVRFPIPFPSFEEQERIVSKIKKIYAILDEIKPMEEEINSLKNDFPLEMKNSIFKSAFSGKITKNEKDDDSVFELEKEIKKVNKKYKKIDSIDIPENWLKFKFKDLFEIINGFTPLRTNNSFWNKKEIAWFTIEDIRRQGRFIKTTHQYITKEALGTSSKRLLPKNTVLLCCTASVGEYAYTNIELTTNQQFNGIVIKDNLKEYISPLYLYEFVKTLKTQMLNNSGKTTFNFLSTKKLGEFVIPIPPLEEQERIVEKIKELLHLCDDIENLLID